MSRVRFSECLCVLCVRETRIFSLAEMWNRKYQVEKVNRRMNGSENEDKNGWGGEGAKKEAVRNDISFPK